MRIALFSDVHSNLEALKSVLRSISEVQVDQIYCLGDLTGYATNPKECIELIRLNNITTLLGNHDEAVVSKYSPAGFNQAAVQGVLFSKKELGKEQMDWLRTRPRHLLLNEEVQLGHANVPEAKWEYIDSETNILITFSLMQTRILFVGHTHLPAILEDQTGNISLHIPKDQTSYALKATNSYIVNVGSVGQPRDRDTRACWMLYDTATQTITMRRIVYDFSLTQSKIRKAGLPEFTATRLEQGR
jgi:predicted phosphodiesterase